MYQFLTAEEKYFDQIIPLLFETGYYEYSAVDNKLNLPASELFKIQILRPYLPYTSVLIDSNAASGEELAGFCITATRKQIEEVEKNTPNWLRDDPQFTDILEKINQFYLHEISDQGLIAHSAAIHPKYRNKGLYRLIQQYRGEIAQKNNCSKIFLLVWQSNPAHRVFEHCGIKYIGQIACPALPFPDQLLKGVFELK